MTESAVSPIALIALVLAAILIFLLPRKYAVIPILVIFFLVPLNQQIVIGPIHLFFYRILILVGMFRMLGASIGSDPNRLPGGFNSIDRAFFWCTICQALAAIFVLGIDAWINQAGFLWDNLGGYFLLRLLIKDDEDIQRTTKCLVLITLVLAVCMIVEARTLHNVFVYLGGNPAPDMRDGRVRCQGSFAHALMAGAFGSTLLCLFLTLWKTGKSHALALTGIVGAAAVTWTSNSSTSLLSFAAGVLGLCLWPIRKSMRAVRWGIVLGLIALQLVMKAPIWFAIAHIDLTGSSSGYHRAALIDTFIRHFFDWWLIGIKDTSVWGWDMWDAQNEFVNVGDTGGLIALVLFIAMISRCFAKLGDARREAEVEKGDEWTLWLLGCALFSNIVAFFGVNYFDQTKFAWFALLAMISAATAPLLHASPVTSSELDFPRRGSPFTYSTPPLSNPLVRKFGSKISEGTK